MFELLFLALALSMDSFAVSIGLGIKEKNNIKTLALKAGLYFGFFQALMPFIGYIGGIGLQQYIFGYDSLIAFVLLSLIGVKMIYEAFGENVEDEISLISNKLLLTLAIATSIDAMAIGFSLHLFSLDPFISILMIGVITFLFSILGVYIGSKGGEKYEKKAEVFGGVVLVLIAFKILIF